MNSGGDLAHARQAAGRMAWAETHATLSTIEATLTGEDLELLACATYMLGHFDSFQRAIVHAQRAFAAEGRRARAARCAFWLAFTLLLRGDHAQAGGWLSRCERLVEAEPEECAERGLLLVPQSVREEADGDFVAAERTSARAAEIGSRAGDQDLHSLALHFQGRAVVKAGRIREGMALLDEAMVAVLAGEVWPPVAGNLYCSMLDACHEIFDLRRAKEWTKALSAWWAAQPDMATFSGQCLVHRADLLHVRGEWPKALDETRRALAVFPRAVDSYASGAAWYRQGELLRVAGDLTGAERAYREASQWGHEPQPGLSLLRLAQGKTAAAQTSIRRVLDESTGALRRARVLPAYVEIMLAVGDVSAAREAAGELERTAVGVDTLALHAMAGHAGGAVLLAEADPRGAMTALRKAWQQWRELDAPYEAARVRALIAQACRALGDLDSATLEHESSQRVFAALGAPMPDPRRVSTEATVLTERELQVLRLVAAGKTNRAIATDLFLAPKTVDRHVTNILAKLGVSSRAAATAYAYEHRLIR